MKSAFLIVRDVICEITSYSYLKHMDMKKKIES